MSKIFPESIVNLPLANIPLKGLTAYLAQGLNNQIIFMEFTEDVDLPEHSHASQWSVVLSGHVDMVIGGVKRTYAKGDTYFVPEGVKHSGKIYAGYADVTFFNQSDRYEKK